MCKKYAVTLLFVTAAIAGCQEFLTISAVNEHTLRPVFQFHYPTGRTPLAVDVLEFSVGSESEHEMLWQIRSTSSYIVAPEGAPASIPAQLKQIEYGIAPDGFVTVVAPKPLRWGQSYQIGALISLEENRDISHAGGNVTVTQQIDGGTH